jgi:hypothetical protein
MIRTALALLLLLASSRPVFAQQPQYCDNFAYPWQGVLLDGTGALNSSVEVPPNGGLEGVYPIDIYFPAPSKPQPTRLSLVSWTHRFPADAPSGSLWIRGFVEVWPRRVPTAIHEAIEIHPEENLQGDGRSVTKNMSMPLTAGMHYTVGLWNANPHPVKVHITVTLQACFATRDGLEQFRAEQYVPGQGTQR